MRFLFLPLLVLAAPAWAQTELATEQRVFSAAGAASVGIPMGRGDAVLIYGVDLEGSTKRLVGTGSVFGGSFDSREGNGFGLSLGVVMGQGRGGGAFTTLSGAFSRFILEDRVTRVVGATMVHTRRLRQGGALDIGVQAGAGLAAPVTTAGGGTNDPQASATLGVLFTTTTGPTRFVARPSVGLAATPASDSGVVTIGLQLGALFGSGSN